MATARPEPTPSNLVTDPGPSRLRFRALGGPSKPFVVLTAGNALLTGAGTVLSVGPAPGRWQTYANRLRDLGEQADRDQMAEDWNRVGADLFVAFDRELEAAPEPAISALHELLSLQPEAGVTEGWATEVARVLAEIRRSGSRPQPWWQSMRGLLRRTEVAKSEEGE